MCSISGFISRHPFPREAARKLSSALLYYGAARGEQSAGAFVNGRVFKRAITPADLIEQTEFFNLFDRDPSVALLHTRQPTSGGRGDAQAQPFRVGETTTVHNGFFFEISRIRNDWKLAKKSGVDSELIARFIDSYGIDLLPKFLESTDGPSAIAALYRSRLYLMRTGNPLSISRLKLSGGNVITVFASTPAILLAAMRHVWLLRESEANIREIQENVLVRLKAHRLSVMSKPITPPEDSIISYYRGKHWWDDSAMWPNWYKQKHTDETNRPRESVRGRIIGLPLAPSTGDKPSDS